MVKNKKIKEDVEKEKLQDEDVSVSVVDENPSDVDSDVAESDVVLEKHEEVLEELENLKKEHENLLENLKKERAEFMNFRQRSNVEKTDLENFVATRILTEMFSSLDSFDMFFMTLEQQKNEKGGFDIEKVDEGVKMIQRQLLSAFSNLGLEEYSPDGELFDPISMEALGVHEVEGIEHEVVEEVYQKGYRLGAKVLRPARVMVNKPKPKEALKEEK